MLTNRLGLIITKVISVNQSGFVKNRFTVYILCLFEEMGGLKIIFHKSDIYCFGEALDKAQQYSDIFHMSCELFAHEIFGYPDRQEKIE